MKMFKFVKILLLTLSFNFFASKAYCFSGSDSASRHKILHRLQFSFDAGTAIPLGLYHSDISNINQSPYTWGGCASTGFTCNITVNLRIGRTLHFIAVGGLIHQPLDAAGLLEENGIPPDVYGNYYYNHISLLFGPSWDFYIVNGYKIGFRILAGDLFFNVPSIKASADNFYLNPLLGKNYSANCNFNFHSNFHQTLEGDLGFTFQKQTSVHISLFFNADILLSTIQFNTSYTVTDMSGNYIGSSALATPTNITMINLTVGVGYNF
jgi:hypothetical protein